MLQFLSANLLGKLYAAQNYTAYYLAKSGREESSLQPNSSASSKASRLIPNTEKQKQKKLGKSVGEMVLLEACQIQ